MTDQYFNRIRQMTAGQILFRDHDCGLGMDEDLGILCLVVMNGERKGNENRRLANGGNLGNRGGAGPAD